MPMVGSFTLKMASKGDRVSQVQIAIQQDWANREYIEVITCSIKKIADFLNSFGKWWHVCSAQTCVVCVYCDTIMTVPGQWHR